MPGPLGSEDAYPSPCDYTTLPERRTDLTTLLLSSALALFRQTLAMVAPMEKFFFSKSPMCHPGPLECDIAAA
ncbi:unnamed protein product [Acanthoscelides obtectus]|uniref:Uncharacterized protein n=1 Tax=Acanthoscelides obtectus TaxID=200917 RepID=A0A9P0JZ15_ACAOB|nr:unnamed protein product [Acanthoscelides obtectus]CAK1623755.1 hypothetical protein AOBTE_LOCUS2157 [Acanthoscelides obtectus]